MRFCICISLLHFSSIFFAQTTVLSENFNNGFPSGWSLIDGDTAIPYNDPAVYNLTESFHTVEDGDSIGIGDSILAATSWFTTNTDANNFLITPSVNLSNNGDFLSFDAKSSDGSYPDGLQIRYTNNDLSIDSIMNSPILFDTIAVPPHWTNFQIRLDTFINSTNVHLVFRHYANNQFILGIDNIKVVTNDPTNIESSNKDMLTIYPNPSSGTIHINTPSLTASNVKIFNSLGVLVWKEIISSSCTIKLPSGIYFLKYKDKVQRIIIK